MPEHDPCVYVGFVVIVTVTVMLVVPPAGIVPEVTDGPLIEMSHVELGVSVRVAVAPEKWTENEFGLLTTNVAVLGTPLGSSVVTLPPVTTNSDADPTVAVPVPEPLALR